MEFENLLVKAKDGVAIVSFNRPKALNALNSGTLNELDLCVSSLERDESVKVIIFTGEGKAFVAGADISEMISLNADSGRAYARLGQGVFSKIENMLKPTIAAVNGFALGGGCELSLACDIRLAGKAAKFGQPEVGLGITPGFAGTQRLPKIVGIAKAKELIFTGSMIDADEAKTIGLVNNVYEDDDLMENALKMALKIARNAKLAVQYSKIAINNGYEVPVSVGNTIEEGYFGMCFATQDQKNGMEAFLNKEKYNFKGK